MTCKVITNDIFDEMLNEITVIKLNSYVRCFMEELSNN